MNERAPTNNDAEIKQRCKERAIEIVRRHLNDYNRQQIEPILENLSSDPEMNGAYNLPKL